MSSVWWAKEAEKHNKTVEVLDEVRKYHEKAARPEPVKVEQRMRDKDALHGDFYTGLVVGAGACAMGQVLYQVILTLCH